jgi:elongation of very long chain fatty acids protein 6
MSGKTMQLPSISVIGIQDWLSTDPYIQSDGYQNDTASYTSNNVTVWWPSLTPLYFKSEMEWDQYASFWARDNIHLSFVVCIIYVLVIFGIKAFMVKRTPLDIRRFQVLWNFSLSVFSFCGMVRMVPQLVGAVLHLGFRASMCQDPREYGGHGASGLWTFLFIFSKIPELFDTVFVVLGKRPLLFLQWYHHITVLLFSWHSYATLSAAGIWFISMNYTVHFVMYFYFALMGISSLKASTAKRMDEGVARESALGAVKSMRRKLASGAPIITVMQISQMAVGIFVTMKVYDFKGTSEVACSVTRSNMLAGFLMYLSYFMLFVVFAFNRYCKKKAKSHKE